MSIKYELIIYWSFEDDSFVVDVPELPGCMADGKTYEEAVENAQQALVAHPRFLFASYPALPKSMASRLNWFC